MKNTLLGVLLAAAAGALGYFVQPEVLTALVVAYPKLAVVAPLITMIVGWALPQLKVWVTKKPDVA